MNKVLMNFVIVLLAIFSLFFGMNYNKQEKEITEQKLVIDSLTKRVLLSEKLSDSLSMELLPIEIELGRYQVAYEIFMERNPKAASQYGDIISQETE